MKKSRIMNTDEKRIKGAFTIVMATIFAGSVALSISGNLFDCTYLIYTSWVLMIIGASSINFEMSIMHTANVFFFQWLFIRLTKHVETTNFDIFIEESTEKEDTVNVVFAYYSLQMFILPCTGWNSDYIRLNKKPMFLRVTKDFLIKCNE